jgi:hypothetical protein
MAFGRPDTELFYAQMLAPAIRAAGAIPKRVVDINHNDDIDNKIFELLDEAKIAVADLTYARPSVYFEAGHATPRIPVVYTCRADHLDRPTDLERVHFDLQMKNIMPWRTPRDAAFQRRVTARLRKLLRPILQRQEQDRRYAQARAQFANLATSVRARTVIDSLRALLEGRGYTVADLQPVADWFRSSPGYGIHDPWFLDFDKLRTTGAFLSAVGKRAGTVTAWLLHFATSTAHRQMANVLDVVRRVPFYDVRPAATASTIHEHVVIGTMDAINQSVATRRIPDAERTGPRELLWVTNAVTSRARLPREVEIYTRWLSRSPADQITGGLQYWEPTEQKMGHVRDERESQVVVRRSVRIHFFDRITTVDDAR